MDKTITSNSQVADEAPCPGIAISHADGVSVLALIEPRPIPVMTAEMIRDKDKLCD